MREIKFRYRYKKNATGEVVAFSASIADLESDFFEDYAFWKQRELLSRDEFTGLHDKNGKEIYEGDILGFPLVGLSKVGRSWGKHYSWFVTVEFEDGAFWIQHTGGLAHESRFLEVCGNIYENPELLK